MPDLGVLRNGGYRDAGLAQFTLSCPLSSFPLEILELGDTLEHLDLSGTGLSSLPSNIGTALPNLKTISLSHCTFKVFPKQLASCPNLQTAVFRNNGMEYIPEDALPPRLRCIILTGNQLTAIPPSIGHCGALEQCFLTDNQLQDLPTELARCKRLTTLRVSSNRLSKFPLWLQALPELAYVSFSSNPCAALLTNGAHAPRGLATIPWSDVEVQQPIDNDTFLGIWKQSPHYSEDVAIRLFRDSIASIGRDDGSAADELAAYLAAGAHESLVTILGRIHGHPDEDTFTDEPGSYEGGLVLQRIPDGYAPLSSVLSFDNALVSSPAVGPENGQFDTKTVLQMLAGLAHALSHLHARGIAHGSLRLDTIFASAADAHALLAGFRGATLYAGLRRARVVGQGAGSPGRDGGQIGEADVVEKVEVLAFGRVVQFLLRAVGDRGREGFEEAEGGLEHLGRRCVVADVGERPGFEEIVEVLEGLMGWRGMMRIPDVRPT
ncbi:uncharacterized protein C8A04DRAFT_38077 [Dichotomopilus funicola]|uniref:Protein kinase domain-containing protein n=1 Tax=Dichotomopilus funicola TaxID=1934379 RepID=A0AAN6V0T5_9PEZI|nr:hypothetical protein C8A04DRAFT_38077 [Dichotomopilus funicola]